MPAVLNNAIDWLSRPYGQSALTGKPFGVVGTTPTPYGGKWSHADAAALGQHRRSGRRRGRDRLAVVHRRGRALPTPRCSAAARTPRVAAAASTSRGDGSHALGVGLATGACRTAAHRLGSTRGRAARPDRPRAGRARPPARGVAARARRALPGTRPSHRRRPVDDGGRVRHAHRRPGPRPRGPARDAGARGELAAVRRADRHQGPQPDRGHPHDVRLAGLRRLRAGRLRRR